MLSVGRLGYKKVELWSAKCGLSSGQLARDGINGAQLGTVKSAVGASQGHTPVMLACWSTCSSTAFIKGGRYPVLRSCQKHLPKRKRETASHLHVHCLALKNYIFRASTDTRIPGSKQINCLYTLEELNYDKTLSIF